MPGFDETAWNLTNHTPPPEAIADIEKLREWAKAFAGSIHDHCPDSREKSLAITNLEQSLMWAVAAIARHPNGELD